MSNVNLEQIKRSEFSDLPKFEKQDEIGRAHV